MTLDTRYDPPRLLVCDRNHQPKGRLLHYSLEGEFIEVVIIASFEMVSRS